MTQKARPSSIKASADLRTDYALIAAAIGASLLALIYLILT
jgi:hypothetical protein